MNANIRKEHAMRFEGKVALVTGGTSGIGEATARRLAAEGARVAIVGRDSERGGTLADQIGADGGEAAFFAADVTQEAAVATMVEAVMSRFGRLDILVNNAGIINFGSVLTANVDEWDLLMATNVRSVFLVSRYALPHMIAGGGGSVVNLGSNLGLVGTRGAVAYATSKGAIVQLTKAMALDHVADNVRVNCVCPGTIDTPLVQRQRVGRTEEQLRQSDARLRERHPIGRMGTPDEVAAVIAFLASDEASFVTGSLYSVDGGYIAQ
jgi:NAD(P)-dependent dehydrogenase (short-subunit alcohol dehydrogenase family)